MGLVMTRPLERVRKRIGLSPMGPTGITSPLLNLIPLSPLVFPPNPHWEARHRMTGYWFAPSPRSWRPPTELLAFLDTGEAPVVISLGAMAMSGEDALEAAQITILALEEAGVRGIIQGWDEPLKTHDLPSSIYHAGSVPHDWLLARASGLVHHGGFGTTAAGFQAGVPMLVIPHIIDQFIWGQRVFELGVGSKPISRSKLNVEAMAEALRQVTQDKDMSTNAQALGEKIGLEHGISLAVQLIGENV